MFDWIPISNYTPIYYHVMFLLMAITLFHSIQNELADSRTKIFASSAGIFLLIFISLYMGTRPVSGAFGDMETYAKGYRLLQEGQKATVTKEHVFNYFVIFCSKIIEVRMFFFICAAIYILPCYIFSRKFGGAYWYFIFFTFVGSYMFWPFGTNGIRNGLGTSIFILALCFYERKIITYLLMALSLGIHSSLIIPIAGFLIAALYKKPQFYIYIWLCAIPLSLIGGSFWENLFGNMGLGDDNRAADYLTKGNVNNDQFSSTGFRWDFLFYSSFAVYAGWYYIFKKNISDNFYIHLWGTYIFANAFWILVIRANFSNRFAYLSWFLMAVVISYPLIRYKIFENQYRVIGGVIAVYYLFTYLMFWRG